ncbi:MAG TPA: acetylornithine deacetylase [Planctomycetaceae bacterium]|nr:acetylornithine deacetylase [Planctomycetaceae bacterium]HRF01068.1 M20 family metallopeptidase [Pirellulaceae bacterium]
MKALRYTRRLITFPSPSQESNRLISKYLERKLTKYGFVVERLEYRDAAGTRKVSLVARRGPGNGGLAYFAHSDTVPAEQWHSRRYGPFRPGTYRERLYGRGACDMKGSIACMLSALQLFQGDKQRAPLYFVVTADEEVGYHGAKQVVAESRFYREMVETGTVGIIGEPTMLEVVHGHKGSCGFRAQTTGRAAHSSTREGINANLAMIPFLAEMKAIHDELESDRKWQDDRFDPPTMSWNIGINDHTAAVNVTAAKSLCTVYFRPLPGIDIEPLIRRVVAAGERMDVHVEVIRSAKPMWTDPESPFVRKALELAHRPASRTVSYGTDGGVFTELEHKIVFGPGSIAQAHTIDEWIAIEQLSLGTELYAKFIRQYCGG